VTADARRSAADERGAILLMGVFMGIFMAGTLYYVVGLASAVSYRERLQDAADATAFAAAVTHARGMNLLVLLNQIMAALLAVLVALKLVELLATLGILLLSVLMAFGVEAAAAAVPALQHARSGARSAYEAVDGPVHVALRALHGAERAVAAAVPALAQAGAVATAGWYTPPARAGFVLPGGLALPVVDDGFGVLCARAGREAAALAMLPLGDHLPGVKDEVEDALGDLAGSASDWFCGKDGAHSPELVRKVKRVLPTLDGQERCEDLASGDTPADDACAALVRRVRASEPGASGECAADCGPGGAYEERIQRARLQCNPKSVAGLRGFSWQERTVWVELARHDGRWAPTGRRREEPPRLVTRPEASFEHPCGTARALYSSEFQPAVHPASGDPRVLPVCASALSPPVATAGVVSVPVTEVLQLFRCVTVEERRISGDFGKSGQDSGGDDQAPVRVDPGRSLGDEAFQLRAVVLGEEPSAAFDGPVGMLGDPAAALTVPPELRRAGTLALAQAEYFFDGKDGRAEWMWSRSWRARLRRLRSPEGDGGSERATCDAVPRPFAALCDGVRADLDALLALSSH
jgi:hypothetical protein